MKWARWKAETVWQQLKIEWSLVHWGKLKWKVSQHQRVALLALHFNIVSTSSWLDEGWMEIKSKIFALCVLCCEWDVYYSTSLDNRARENSHASSPMKDWNAQLIHSLVFCLSWVAAGGKRRPPSPTQNTHLETLWELHNAKNKTQQWNEHRVASSTAIRIYIYIYGEQLPQHIHFLLFLMRFSQSRTLYNMFGWIFNDISSIA